MENVSFGDMLFRLIISLLLGGLIGLEREAHERPAGLRTHILVCVGSTFFTLASFAISKSYAGYVFDPGRITAQIVTGIGFLGAGTIIRTGTIVRGLTTAASIWTVAAIGVGVGVGGKMLWLSIAASVLVFGTLTTVRSLEQFLSMKRNERTLIATVRSDKNALCNLLSIITKMMPGRIP